MENYGIQMKKLLLALLILAAAVSVSAQTNFDKGLRHYENKEYSKAVDYFRKHLKKKPKDMLCLNYLGLAYIFTQQPDSAVYFLTKAIEIDSSLSDSFNNRGFAYSFLGAMDSSLSDFNKAIELDSNSSRAYLNRGSLYGAWKTYTKAIDDYSKAIELEPGIPEAYYQRGIMLYKVQKYQESFADLSKAIEMGVSNEELLQFKGNAEYRLQRYAEAIKDYSEALKINPNNVEVLNNRGMSYSSLGDSIQASKDWESLKKLNKLYNSILPLDTISYCTFITTDSAVSIVLPSWNSIEHLDSNKSEMLISPDSISKSAMLYSTGCYISINRNIDKLFKYSSADDIIDYWKSSNENNLKEYLYSRPITQKTYKKNGWSCINLMSDIQIDARSSEMRYFQHARAFGNTLLFVYFQVPSVLYKYYEKIIAKAIDSIVITDKRQK